MVTHRNETHGTKQYPLIPSEDDCCSAFCRWYANEYGVDLIVKSRPDEMERNARAIDCLLAPRSNAADSSEELALEISSIFRHVSAGREDRALVDLQEEFDRAFSDLSPSPIIILAQDPHIKLNFRNISGDLNALLGSPAAERTCGPAQDGFTVLGGARCLIQWRDVEARPTAMRMAPPTTLDEVAESCRKVLSQKSGTLAEMKPRHTWLLVYNTAWTLLGDDPVQDVFRAKRAAVGSPPDHLLLLSGNPPDDAWGTLVW